MSEIRRRIEDWFEGLVGLIPELADEGEAYD